jgi:hypothetical protein
MEIGDGHLVSIPDLSSLYYRSYALEPAAVRTAEGLIAVRALIADRGADAALVSGLSRISTSAVPQLLAWPRNSCLLRIQDVRWPIDRWPSLRQSGTFPSVVFRFLRSQSARNEKQQK